MLASPVLSVAEPVFKLLKSSVIELIDSNAPEKIALVFSTIPPYQEQFVHTKWRREILVAQKDENSVAASDFAHELGNAVARFECVFVTDNVDAFSPRLLD
jgi:hypothetical protein